MTTARDGFAALIGTWHTRGRIVDGGDLDGAEIDGTDSYEWWGERFVVHHADVALDGRPQRGIEIFTLGDGSGFEATAYTDDGTTESVTGSFGVDGVYRAGNETSRVTLRIDDDTMAAHWELLHEGRWRPWMDLTFTRGAA